MAIPAETIFLDPDSDRTLQQQIQQAVANGILFGRFEPGEKMPSTRALARHLGVARITVSLAYTELVASEYLVSRDRSGYFVSDAAPGRPHFDQPLYENDDEIDWSQIIDVDLANSSALVRPINWRDYQYPFIYGQSDPTLFDHQSWRLCGVDALGRKNFEPMTSDYYERDDPILIEYILRHIAPRRGITARPEQVLLTMGAQNALWMAGQILLSPERRAAVERPGYPGLSDILRQTRCRTTSIDVDAEGLPPDLLPDDVNVVFTTPSHHCPTTVTMPLDRRMSLLSRAARDGFIIVEDDYEFEIGSLRSPAPALKSLDRTGCVIYVGSFSKSIFPGLRLGYMIASEPFIRQARALRSLVLRHPPGHIQRTLAYFLSLGYYDAQVARIAEAYRRRRATMADAIQDEGLEIVHPEHSGGSSFWMRAPDGVNTMELAQQLRTDGVLIEPGHAFFSADDPDIRFYRLAYSSIRSARIPEGVARLARAIAATGAR